MHRIRTYLLFVPFMIQMSIVNGQINDLIGKWTNGNDFYISSLYQDSLIVFSGGNLHEGGAYFTVQVFDDSTFEIIGRLPGEQWEPSIGEIGLRVSPFEDKDQRAILLLDKKGSIREMLRMMGKYKRLDDVVIENMINYQLAGVYTNQITGEAVTFQSEKPRVSGLPEGDSYKFAEEYDFPMQTLIFTEGGAIAYEKTEDGLDIHRAVLNQYEEWEKKEKLYSLTKTEWMSPKHSQHLSGRFGFASTVILTDDILDFFSKKELRLIRNEIFARHGYTFKTKEMFSYFASQDWYVAKHEDVTDKITALERLNISQIRKTENEK